MRSHMAPEYHLRVLGTWVVADEDVAVECAGVVRKGYQLALHLEEGGQVHNASVKFRTWRAMAGCLESDCWQADAHLKLLVGILHNILVVILQRRVPCLRKVALLRGAVQPRLRIEKDSDLPV